MKRFKKLFISVISIFLTLCVALSVGIGCAEGTTATAKKEQVGTHILTMELTDKPFISNGATNYKLLTPAKPTEYEALAKKEFMFFWKEATGNSIAAVTDNPNLTWDNVKDGSTKYISLGSTSLRNSLPDSAGFNYDWDTLEDDGVRIKTIEDHIFLTGATDMGTVYSAYTFMELLFNYDIYWVDFWEIDNVQNKNLPEFNVTDVPDILQRASYKGETDGNYESLTESDDNYRYYGWRTRSPLGYGRMLQSYPKYAWDDNVGGYTVQNVTGSTTMHNSMELLPMNVYSADHPSWYSSGSDLCYTSGTKSQNPAECEAEADLMYRELAKRVVQAMMFNYADDGIYYGNFYNITHEDASNSCSCWKCLETSAKYGGNYSSIYILAMNKIAGYVEEILEGIKAGTYEDPSYYYHRPEDPDNYYFTVFDRVLNYEDFYKDDWNIIFFAYSYSSNAPVSMDSKGKVSALAPEMYLDDRVTVWFADDPGTLLDLNYSGNVQGQRFIKNAKGWDLLSPNGYITQGYLGSFTNTLLSLDVYQGYGKKYIDLLIETNCKQWFVYDGYDRDGNGRDFTYFGKLYYYTTDKLTWNSNLDYETLKAKFFKAMYREAADEMLQMYNALKTYSAYQMLHNPNLNIDSSFVKPSNYSFNVMLDLMAYTDRAVEKIEYLKDIDYELYQKTKKNINSEYMAPAYAVLNFYSNRITPDKLLEIKTKFSETAIECQFHGYEDFVNGLG